MNHAQLIALGRSLRVAGEHGQGLSEGASMASPEEIRRDLERAMGLLSDAVSSPKPVTRCGEHPNGPVDEDAADLCLLCETRRRTGQRPLAQSRAFAGDEEDEPPVRLPSQYTVRAEQPEPRDRWMPEMWNGRTWQLCGTPRHSRQAAEEHLEQLLQAPDRASAYRLVHAFTDHNVVRVWGTPTVRTPEL
ncbi:hypothetical protein [Streptomyces lincolnensis]|uniref:hypothetical protein n=1 Tax=Streptomyces lincolnensis TaxID=1915 RepID=UPI0037D3319D